MVTTRNAILLGNRLLDQLSSLVSLCDRVTAHLSLASTSDFLIFRHDLPLHRGQEVVFDFSYTYLGVVSFVMITRFLSDDSIRDTRISFLGA